MTSEPIGTSRWTVLRDACTAVREMMLIMAVAAIVLMPQRVQQFLSDSGVRSIAGVEFDLQKFKDAQNELRLAQSGMQGIQEQLNSVSRVLAENSSTQVGVQSVGEPSILGSARFGPTVDIDQLRQAVQSAQKQGNRIEQHLMRADHMSRQAVPAPLLTSPDVLFGDRSASNLSEQLR